MWTIGESGWNVYRHSLCYACSFSERFQFFQNKKVRKILQVYLSPSIISTKSEQGHPDVK